ncbi:MAG: alanine--tRNA ligase [bacterium]
MQGSEIRQKFIKYFEGKEHKILPSSSLIPEDKTVLLTLAGMLQFKPIFLGKEKAKYSRVTTVQKCIRTNDIENVGKTPRHHTFFEMLGNFSFGDYFKEDAIKYAWDLLTDIFKLDKEKLHIAVYEKDDESADIWRTKIGIPDSRIYGLDEDNNFWAVGDTGPCGPCSEIYYDFGPNVGCGSKECKPSCDCSRFLEIWNLVFMQYDRDETGKLHPLPKKNIDTGMGLERIASVLQKVSNNFETDLFTPIIKGAQDILEVKKVSSNTESFHIIADHLRGAVHLLADGVRPSNEGRGYILRRIIRRAQSRGYMLGTKKPFLSLLVPKVVAITGKVYPEIEERAKQVSDIIRDEEEQFLTTLSQGMQILDGIMEKSKNKQISGQDAFLLHDTYGFPMDLTREISQVKGYTLDQKSFETALNKQREMAREAGIKTDKIKDVLEKIIPADLPATRFLGYEILESDAKVLFTDEIQGLLVVDQTPFYGESGGQVGDVGQLRITNAECRINGTLKTDKGVIVHEVEGLKGAKVGTTVKLTVDILARMQIAANHTGTHLLHASLRKVLGEGVLQSGSYVGPDYLRFDFSHRGAVPKDKLDEVESIVNQKIKDNIILVKNVMKYDDAKKSGAMALFGEKYGDEVRVVEIPGFSVELCGGTHTTCTAEIGMFTLYRESAVASGVRRIEAFTGAGAQKFYLDRAESLSAENQKLRQDLKHNVGSDKESSKSLEDLIAQIETAANDYDGRICKTLISKMQLINDKLKEDLVRMNKELERQKLRQASGSLDEVAAKAEEYKSIKLLHYEASGVDANAIRTISDNLLQKLGRGVVAVSSGSTIAVKVSDDVAVNAAALLKDLVGICGGRGGGKDKMAMGSVEKPELLSSVFYTAAKKLL